MVGLEVLTVVLWLTGARFFHSFMKCQWGRPAFCSFSIRSRLEFSLPQLTWQICPCRKIMWILYIIGFNRNVCLDIFRWFWFIQIPWWIFWVCWMSHFIFDMSSLYKTIEIWQEAVWEGERQEKELESSTRQDLVQVARSITDHSAIGSKNTLFSIYCIYQVFLACPEKLSPNILITPWWMAAVKNYKPFPLHVSKQDVIMNEWINNPDTLLSFIGSVHYPICVCMGILNLAFTELVWLWNV